MRTAALLAAFLSFAPPAFSQQITTGVIQGTVTDVSGAVVPGVTVEVKNADTNLVRTQTTATDGRFIFLQLPTGRYNVTYSLTGFATLIHQDITLTVGQSITLTAEMKVSNVSETVRVDAASPVVETLRSSSASTLNQMTVESTPILGRKFEDLLTLTPGVSVVQGPDGDEITFAGQRGVFNNISLDGGDFNNGFFGEQAGGQRAAIDITLEAVKEFQVIATGAPAEFGRTAGGVVNVITKSGTNATHGSLFHFQRLEALTGDLSDGSQLEDFHREQFGGTIGGPIRQRQGVLLRGGGRDRRRLPAAESEPAAGHDAVPGEQSDGAAERSAHQREQRLPANGAPQLLPDEPRAGRGAADQASDQHRGPARQTRRRDERVTARSRHRGRSTGRGRRTKRSTSRPMARRRTASRAIRRTSTSAT